ncbi:hypothetical protein HD_1283 [[Haemophilus] ducreyi 35000HP]|uniref:Uncharacterized protein n=1 Tax=Haemophilus ducreyi (strain 35000HP / ATCC 700724) TaxID=233412 RepID=Q7VLW5_HAEDU|nr:hypothetical protein HD_1283 [[Haemophilus] ducreyi 35000HP]
MQFLHRFSLIVLHYFLILATDCLICVSLEYAKMALK